MTVHDPICSDDGDREWYPVSQLTAVETALYGSFLPVPSSSKFSLPETSSEPLPGAVICKKEKIQLSPGRKRWLVEVKNEGDRPIQVRPCLLSTPSLDLMSGRLALPVHRDEPFLDL